ncbi:hypothetical protein K450DRAFT_223359 [Umbelopsis ramanniana AG]|uniref:Secreted protein n=1 Tax=Umbelopsis ramanniana AG TaxID=1314678 RepID=A0AAD5HGC9_UMBRA|nr:uncharacterized protein K450DRAFT_223359 [Umbelopsis ramanniana AG]KAI8583382.1 hypothetical protein K450DRAFT_223359 [Umbelopsis ramanniana AG]
MGFNQPRQPYLLVTLSWCQVIELSFTLSQCAAAFRFQYESAPVKTEAKVICMNSTVLVLLPQAKEGHYACFKKKTKELFSGSTNRQGIIIAGYV